jgi:hypothetical protein
MCVHVCACLIWFVMLASVCVYVVIVCYVVLVCIFVDIGSKRMCMAVSELARVSMCGMRWACVCDHAEETITCSHGKQGCCCFHAHLCIHALADMENTLRLMCCHMATGG